MNRDKLEKFDVTFFSSLSKSEKEQYVKDFIVYTLNKNKNKIKKEDSNNVI